MSRELIDPYKIIFVTRNGANQIANKTETSSIANAISNQNQYHAIFFTGQEESRDKPFFKSFERSNIHKETPVNQFNTQTGIGPHSSGQIYHYSFLRRSVKHLHTDQYQEKSAWYKTKNKGGAYDIVDIHQGTFSSNEENKSVTDSIIHCPIASCGVHLDSYSNEARLRETQMLMSKIEKDITGDKIGYEKLIALATVSVLFGGDLNYRNRIENNQSIDPSKSKDNPMHHFALWGLSEAQQDNTPTYLKKNAHKRITTYDAIADEEDSSRPGETRGGKLDRVFYRGPITLTKEQVIPNTNQTTDHKTVMAAFSITPIVNEIEQFEAAKQYVKTMIIELKKYFSNDELFENLIINSIDTLDYFEKKNNDYLGQLFEKLLTLRNQAIEAEKHRMKALDAEIKMKSFNPFKWFSGYFSFPKKHNEIVLSISAIALTKFKQEVLQLPKTSTTESSPISKNHPLKQTISNLSDSSNGSSLGYTTPRSPDNQESTERTPLLISKKSFTLFGSPCQQKSKKQVGWRRSEENEKIPCTI